MIIVLDIDGALTSVVNPIGGSVDGDEKEFLDRVQKESPDSIIPIVIEDETYIHYVHYGVFEFMRWLAMQPNLLCAFFSSAVSERNEAFVPELFARAFPDNSHPSFVQKAAIFSRQHCFDTTYPRSDRDLYQPKYPCLYGNSKKDLQVVLDHYAQHEGMDCTLEDILLVDDDPSWVIKGQEKNFVYVQEAQWHEFHYEQEDWYRINHMFYLVGLLDKVLKSDVPTQTLFDTLFPNDTPGYHAAFHDKTYYDRGLSILQRINTELCFLPGIMRHT